MTYIIGAGGNAVSIANIMSDLDITVSGFVVDKPASKYFLGVNLLSYSDFETESGEISCVISIGHNSHRKEMYRRLTESFLERISFPTLIHPTSYVSKSSFIGEGSIIYPFAAIGAESVISRFVQLNTHSNIEHGSKAAEFSSLAPGSVLAGNSEIGPESAALSNATISNGVKIGKSVVIGANSFLKESTGDNEIWVGTPAHMVKTRMDSDSYL